MMLLIYILMEEAWEYIHSYAPCYLIFSICLLTAAISPLFASPDDFICKIWHASISLTPVLYFRLPFPAPWRHSASPPHFLLFFLSDYRGRRFHRLSKCASGHATSDTAASICSFIIEIIAVAAVFAVLYFRHTGWGYRHAARRCRRSFAWRRGSPRAGRELPAPYEVFDFF